MKKHLHQLWQPLSRTLRRQPGSLFLLAVMLLAVVQPLWLLADYQRYHLTPATENLVGEAHEELAKGLKYDANTQQFRFNAEAIESEKQGSPEEIAQQLTHQQQTGGADAESKQSYALDLPVDPEEGATFYDINTQTSFSLTPNFAMGEARKEAGRVVYPLHEGGQAVYTAKNNGVKEDIVLQKPRGDALTFSYQLDLPKTLEARVIEETGELGIYSTNPVLFGNISFGSTEDEEKIKSARETGKKNHLVFVLPAPTIVQSSGTEHDANAKFVLDGTTLDVVTEGLQQLSYPISIDPSVVVTSTADFREGNNDSNINFGTDSVTRGALTGGEVEPWQTSSSFTTARDFTAGVAHRGYFYIIGGFTGSPLDSVQYAPINSNGTLGTFQATTALLQGLVEHAAVGYNGHIYVLGGSLFGGAGLNTVQYAPMNDDGTLGTWQNTSTFNTGRSRLGAEVYGGYLYGVGGWTGSATLNSVEYAPVNADGTVGSWTTTSAMNAARDYYDTAVYNGFLYAIQGHDNGSFVSSVEVARLNDDGSVGSWATTTSPSGSRYRHKAMGVGGFLYIVGGDNGTNPLADVSYTPVNADGTLGTWRSTSALTAARSLEAADFYDGRLYAAGGASTGGTRLNTTEYATLRPAGYTAPYTATSAFTTARTRFASVVYNGYIYVSGGYSDNAMSLVTNTTRYALLNADGTTGTWQTGTALPVSRYGHTTVAYNGYMYLLGGHTTGGVVNTVHYAVINANGSLGTWNAAANNFATARHSHGSIVYNGYVYVMGGANGSTYYGTVEYAPLQTSGNVGTWNTTTSMPAARSEIGIGLANGYVYTLGGRDAGTLTNAVNFAPLNNDGTVGTWTATNAFASALMTMAVTVGNGHMYLAGGRTGGGVAQSGVQYTRINQNGTIDPWQTNNSLTAARFGNRLEFANGYLYNMGGHDGTTVFNTVQYTPTNSGGNGFTNTWASTSSFATARALHGAVTHNGRIYIFGGTNSTNTPINNVQYATINQNGTLGSWTATTSMPAARAYFGTAIDSGYIYVVGGYDAALSPTNTVYYAPINGDGTVGTWNTTTTFTNARGALAAATYQFFGNSYIYLAGGFNGSTTRYNDVQFAIINPSDGTLGSWTATTSFSGGRAAPEVVAYGARLYVMGGEEHSTLNLLNDVQHAPINSDGTLGTWTRTTSFNIPRFGAKAVARNGYLYLTGGNDNTNASARTEYAAIDQGGGLGAWQTSPNTFTTARSGHALAYNKGRLYILGGNNTSGTKLSDVQQTGLQMTPRSGLYTRLIDLGRTSRLSSITHNAVPYPSENMFFSVAGEDGVFGAKQSISSLTTPIDGVRYVQVFATLNDSRRGNFSYDTRTALTNITVNYRPTYLPEERLRHGKFFYDGELIQMDTE